LSKGFTINKDRRAERDAECVDYKSTMQWAMANRPGAVPIGGGRKAHYAERVSHAYSNFREQGQKHKGHRKFDMRFKLGRYTPPRVSTTVDGDK